MTYDDAGWHYDTTAEHDLDYACAATHIGMFFAWLVHHGMADHGYVDLSPLLERTSTPGAFLLQRCAGEMNRSMVTDQGAAFVDAAYKGYLRVYQYIPEIARCAVSYAAPDTWETYDAVSPVIDEAYAVYTSNNT